MQRACPGCGGRGCGHLGSSGLVWLEVGSQAKNRLRMDRELLEALGDGSELEQTEVLGLAEQEGS